MHFALPYDCHWCRGPADHESDDHPDDLPEAPLPFVPCTDAEFEDLLAAWSRYADALESGAGAPEVRRPRRSRQARPGQPRPAAAPGRRARR